jgi:hypothetical protein
MRLKSASPTCHCHNRRVGVNEACHPIDAAPSTAEIAYGCCGAMLSPLERLFMKRALLLIALLLGGILPGVAAELGAVAPARAVVLRSAAPALPFPRSERAQSVWAASACWSDCGSHCTWGLAACLTRDAQGHCLKLGDACDRYCQRECRTGGGPLVSDIFDAWE